MKKARDESVAIGVEQLKSLFDECVIAGFTESQALELCKTVLLRGEDMNNGN